MQNHPLKSGNERPANVFVWGHSIYCTQFHLLFMNDTQKEKSYNNKLYNMLNQLTDTHFLGVYFLKKCCCQSCSETPSYFTITSKWKQELKQIHICNPLLAADNDWHVVWPQNLWLSVITIMYFKTFGKKTKGDA